LLDQAINLVTNRDEKAALEEAKKHLMEAEQKAADFEKKATANAQRAEAAERQVADLQAKLNKSQADSQAIVTKLQAEAQGAKTYIAQLEARVAAAEAKAKLYEDEKLSDQRKAAMDAAERARTLDTHTLTDKETLSDLALKYYGHATEPYWRLIYEANKEAIGANPNRVRPGVALKIPVLPPEMKK